MFKIVSRNNITNTYTPGKTRDTSAKEWIDNNNQDKIRPDSIKVQLLANRLVILLEKSMFLKVIE